jgi:pyruvate-formate lyase-activating enzyme
VKTPFLVVCDPAGNAVEVPELRMAVPSNGGLRRPDERSLVPLPKGSVLFTLPGRVPAGYDSSGGRFVFVKEYRGRPVAAAAAFLPPGYMHTYVSAYRERGGAPRLPLYCYAAVGWKEGRFYAAAVRVDRQMRHAIPDGWFSRIDLLAKRMLKRYPRNRLIGHLMRNCVRTYRCPNACNLVLGRWECPVPVSPACNAACLGCISHQPKDSGVPSTQHRLAFVPTCAEITEYVVPHLSRAANPIASFGQGCEGEPLLQARLLEEAIRSVRARTARGVINMNTNASRPADVERLCAAGLDSMRVSLNSARRDLYHAYYRPKDYSFDDVVESIRIARRNRVWVSLNYLVFPGLTDSRAEFAALKGLLRRTGINMVQTRNLNIDPAWYSAALGTGRRDGRPLGMAAWLGALRKEFPEVKLGYFNPTPAAVRQGMG